MRWTDRRWVVGAWTLVLIVSVAGAGVASGAGTPAASATDATGQAATAGSTAPAANATHIDNTIVQTNRYALLPDRPGSVRVRVTYDIPDRVQSLETQFRTAGTVTDTEGFNRINGTAYEWDESTATASLTVRYDVNETTSRTGPEATDGRYLFADVGEWALFKRFPTRTGWRYSGGDTPVTIDQRSETAGPGAVGDRLIYLGAASTAERTANGQRIRLVVPEAADLEEPPEAILASLTNASTSLRIGDRDERVVAFAAPTGRVEWGVRGLAYGGSEFWVRDFERLDEPANVWLHEYVHTRQGFRTTAETRWLTEATAQYYAAQLTLEQERTGFDAYRRYLASGERSTYDDVVLATPSTWTANANYVKGALAVGRLDVALRAATNRTGTLEGVMRDLNRGDQPVTQAAFLDAVATVGGADSRATAAELSATSEPVSMWDQRTQSRLFQPVPAQISYGLPTGADGYRASGPYRNATIPATPVRLAAGERLTVDTVVSNTGGRAGTYSATLTVDGRAAASATGQLDAESERTVPLAHTFDRPGEYTLGTGEETATVVVEAPAEPTVSNVRVDRERLRAGDSVRVTATVRNDASVPANGSITFTRDGEPVTARAVTLSPGTSTELSVAVGLPTAGTVRLGAGTAEPVTVRVVTPTGTATGQPAGTSDGNGPGFTAAVAVLAALTALLARRR